MSDAETAPSEFSQSVEENSVMKRTITVVGAALGSVVLLSGPAGAQGTTQTVAKVDV
jgi:hypothetical protein